MKYLQPKYAVYSYGRQEFYFLTPKTMDQPNNDSKLCVLYALVIICFEKCTALITNLIIKCVDSIRCIKSFIKKTFIKHIDSLLSLTVVLTFLSLMVA